MEIILNCMPPFNIENPSPAMSILKSHLCKYGYSVRIIYWNLLFYNLENEFIWIKKKTDKRENLSTIIYAAYLTTLRALITENDMINCEIEDLKEKVDILFSQGLVYRTPCYNEIVSILNTNKNNSI